MQEGIGVEGESLFEANITMCVGNGFNIFFWSDCWVGSVSLRGRFRGLYDMSTHKDFTVGEMHALGWVRKGGRGGGGVDCWCARRS